MKPIVNLVTQNDNTVNPFKNFFGAFFDDDTPLLYSKEQHSFSPQVNVIENDREYILELYVPGKKKEDFQISVEKQQISISSTKKEEKEEKKKNYIRKDYRFETFEKTFNLSDDINPEEIEAQYLEGVLKVHLKKREDKAVVKKLIHVK